jgi:ATP diphosphatase
MDARNAQAMADEMGDLLFSAVNLARHLNIDPEAALRAGNDKFERRFRYLEIDLAGQGLDPKELDIVALEDAWVRAKNNEITQN